MIISKRENINIVKEKINIVNSIHADEKELQKSQQQHKL